MIFAIMVWSHENARPTSIFGVIDAATTTPVLPMLTKKGHWAEYRKIEEGRFKFANEARAAIARDGYYLMGASVTVTEAFGAP